MKRNTPNRDQNGFMLIELAVAALVIGIGILALLGVAHIAERAASDAEAETRAALFADDVFTTLRLHSDNFSQSTNQIDWIDNWISISKGDRPLSVASSWLPVWDNARNDDYPRVVFGDGKEHTTYWIPVPASEEPAAVPDYAVRYRMTIARPGQNPNNPPLPLDEKPLPAMLLVTLHVWSGVSKLNAEPCTFFTAFSNSGSLP